MSDKLAAKLHSTMDARIWAEEFCNLNPDIGEGLMLSWFANAIMVGHDHATRKLEAERDEIAQRLERKTQQVEILSKGWPAADILRLEKERDEYKAVLEEMYRIHGKDETCAKCESNAGDDHIASCKARHALEKYGVKE